MSQRIHVVLITFFNPDQTITRWTRDVLPAVAATGLEHCVTVVDNSPQASPQLHEQFGPDYLWQEGRNLLYGPSINLAVPRHPSDYVLYVCTKHGRALDNGWVRDLLLPLQNEPKVGMTGYLIGSNSPEGVAHACNAPWIKDQFRFVGSDGVGYVPQHIQGGVFLARTGLMLQFPYPPDVAHLYTDHILTWNILKAGFECRTIPSICSVWRGDVRDPRNLKFIHAENYT